MAGNGIQPEKRQEQEQESHVLPSSVSLHTDASSNSSEPNPPSTPLSTTIVPALTPDSKTPATSCNLLSWFRHPLATFRASLKRRHCASSSGDNNDPSKTGRKKKAQILDDEAAETNKALQDEKKAPGSGRDPELLGESIPKGITTAHVADCRVNDDDDVYVKKEDMDKAGKEEKAKATEQQGSPENVVENKWVGEPIDITGGNKHRVSITLPNNKQPESAQIRIEEAAAAHPTVAAAGLKMNQQLAAGIQDAAENAEEATPATEDTAVTAVSSGIGEIK